MEQVNSTVHPRLYRRGAKYYHRAAIPIDIKATYPKIEETFSLRTSDYREAICRIRVAAAEVDQRFEEHRRNLAAQASPMVSLSAEQIDRLAWRYYVDHLDDDERYRREFDWNGYGDFDAVYEVLTDELANAIHANTAGQAGERFIKAAGELVAHEFASPLAPESPSWDDLAWKLQEAYIRAIKAMLARQQGELIPTPREPAQPLQENPQGVANLRPVTRSSAASTGYLAPSDTSDTPMLSLTVEEWLGEKARDWTPKTLNDHKITLANFITIVGDRPLADYGKADGRAFKAVLLKLPPNWNKQKELRALSIDAAASRAGELGMAPMSGKNVNKIIGYAAAFWNWVAAHYDDVPANPLAGLKVKLNRSIRQDRHPFTIPELKTIFHAPVFTGCKSLHFWRQPGNVVPRDSGMFWTPLISLLSGMRMGEVLQLYTNDVKKTDDGIIYFDINGDGADKSLKTQSSWRTIPAHPELLKMGLMDHVERMRQRGSLRLFPGMEMGKDGYYSSVYSKRFRQLLDGLGIKHNKNAFHSFRHNFEDVCRDSGISSEVMNVLQGHTESGMAGRYGSGYTLVKLYEEMQKLSYRELDLSHLHQ